MAEASAVEEKRAKDRSLSRDFAPVAAGYLVGHGVLRLFAGILTGLNDAPRAELLLRWLPAWNALGWFVAAWGLYLVVVWAGQRGTVLVQPVRVAGNPAALGGMQTESRPDHGPNATGGRNEAVQTAAAGPPDGWKERLKGLQKRREVESILEFQKELQRTLPPERAQQLDRRLGRWYTKHFQHVMLTGKAAESLADVERVAEYYAESEEFAYFREILPVVRQCAELKQSIQEEE